MLIVIGHIGIQGLTTEMLQVDSVHNTTVRRIGVGFMLADQEGGVVHGAHFNFPGKIQTVTRGELFAFVVLIRFIEPLAKVEFVTDNYNVFRTFNGGPAAGVNSANCDLYGEIFKLIYDKALDVKLRWIPSHLKENREGRTRPASRGGHHGGCYSQ